MRNTLITLLFTLCVSCIFAQKQFEGIITYNISTSKESVGNEEAVKIPKQQKTYYKDGMMRMESKTTSMDMTIMSNDKKEEASFMINFMGMKMAINTTKDQIKSILTDDLNYQIKYTKHKKIIAGYKCKEAILRSESGNATIYVCEQLNIGNSNWFINQKIEGAILELSIEGNDDYLLISANNVKKQELNAAFFQIPEGYIQMGQKELEAMFGGNSPF